MSPHQVSVWEWFDEAACVWRAYSPPVSQQLERAHVKHLTRVVLSDADPELDAYVNLRTRTQCVDTSDGTNIECGVRRMLYSVLSPAGRGARWEWARGNRLQPTELPADAHWQPLPMQAQCELEDALSRGISSLELSAEASMAGAWRVELATLTARGPGGAAKLLRRVTQAPYPLVKAPQTPELTSQGGRRKCIPQQHTGSSVKSAPAAVGRNQEYSKNQENGVRPNENGVRTNENGREHKTKHNLARILNNLNIFSNSKQSNTMPNRESPPLSRENARQVTRHSARSRDSSLDRRATSLRSREIARPQVPKDHSLKRNNKIRDVSETRMSRRPSVDTISTYLSQESKESINQPAVGDLLNCSIGSDEVFDTPKPKLPDPGSIISVESAWRAVSAYVRVCVAAPRGERCPVCGTALLASHDDVLVSLTHCHHVMHLRCLNAQLNARKEGAGSYIECPRCGRLHGNSEEVPGPGGGSMSWCVLPRSLPGQTHNTNTLQITYDMVSGTQGSEHPRPGQPYYAVGFPRVTYLPDNPLGRKVLNLLWLAWERRKVFTIGVSATTGREYVVTWARGLEQRLHRKEFTNKAETENYVQELQNRLVGLGLQDDQHVYQELT